MFTTGKTYNVYHCTGKLGGRGEAVDIADTVYEINSFLDKHLCLFSQGLTYPSENIKVNNSILSI